MILSLYCRYENDGGSKTPIRPVGSLEHVAPLHVVILGTLQVGVNCF
jgi:hypothetical protein